jgi:type VI secretion system protein ImpI
VYLSLQVTGRQAAALGASSSKIFDQRGGSVGRGPQNDWVLPDPERYVSTQHFIIRCMNNAFYLEDVSTNGVFLNGIAEPVRDRGDAVILNSGDRIVVGEYEIVASIVADQPDVSSPPPAAQPIPPISSTIDEPPLSNAPVDPLEMLGHQPVPAARPATYSDHAPVASQHFAPPGPSASSSNAAIPADFELTGFSTPSNPAPSEAESIASPGDPLMYAVVQGLMEILSSRKDIKSEFRVPVTTLKPMENNPLKFFTNADDAMRHLFGAVEPGFMTPEEAIQEGLQDIKAHQLAMMAGMREAFAKMLERFDPEKLEAIFSERAKSGSLISKKGKAKYWDLYCQMFGDLTRDSDDSFGRLFGEAFAEAYERQMQTLLKG